MEDIYNERLVIKSFDIQDVVFGEKNSISDHRLTIDKEISNKIGKDEVLVKKVDIDIIYPHRHDIYVNSIMDIIPISTKALGKIGEGITHTLTGVYVMLTGITEEGRQFNDCGSSDGLLKDHLMLGRPGTPAPNDFIVRINVTVQGGLPFGRDLTLAAHHTADEFVDKLRHVLKNLDAAAADERHEYYNIRRPGRSKVVLVKLIAGQGAMYDNIVLPNEPSGFAGGRSIIDMGNIPIMLTPNEYRDGAIRAMT
jgi:D-proline reductase (dithiol) PrdD